jgi:membrane peptidoglycan carboxypeptidase
MPDTRSLVRARRTRRLDQRRARESRWRMSGVGIGLVVSLVLALLILATGLAYADLTRDLPNIGYLAILLNPPDGLLLQPTRLYDRSGKHLLLTFAPTDGPRRYIPLNPQSPQHLPAALAKATVAIDDPGFWSQSGYALTGWNDPEVHPTLAQQLVSDLLLYDEPPSLRRALRERILAGQAAAKYGRSQILEWAINSADYGDNAFGAEAAAQLYLGKSVTELTIGESALLASMAQAPGSNRLEAQEGARQRRDLTIQRMWSLGMISGDETVKALAEPVPAPGPLPEPSGNGAPAFLHLVLSQLDQQFARERIVRGGVTITTTLDYDLQQEVACTTLVYVARLQGNTGANASCPAADLLPALPPDMTAAGASASALVLDPQAGQVLAAVGETLRGVETASLGAHDPGSLITPFVYLTAFTRGLSPGSLVWDIPPAGEAPRPGALYQGPVRMRISLANDYEAPAQAVAAQMGTEAIGRTETSFGLRPGNETLLDLAAAYGIFAAQGVRYGQPGPSTVLRVEGLDHSVWLDLANPQAQPVLAAPLAYIMNDVLSDETARQPSLGHPSPLEIERPAGAKIGQTAAGLDSWTVGYTPARVVAVWIGAPAAGSVPVRSPRVASNLWKALIQLAAQPLPPDGWLVPAGVTAIDVCDPSGMLPTKDCPSVVSEVFLNGNEPVQADTLYKTFVVNRETGYLATVFTPPQLVEDRVYMVVPPEAQAWAKSANIPVAPTTYDAIQAEPIRPDVRIAAPAMFDTVNGQVQIRGTASGANFDRYRVVVGQGLNPQQWIVVGNESGTPVEDGLLATWDTTGLNGLYAVQLQVIRKDQRVDATVTQVTVGAN